MAQLVEQRIRNAWVAGSSPAIGSLHRKKSQKQTLVSGSFLSTACHCMCRYCFCGISSVGRALASQAEGRGFESRIPLKFIFSHLIFRTLSMFGCNGKSYGCRCRWHWLCLLLPQRDASLHAVNALHQRRHHFQVRVRGVGAKGFEQVQ